MFYFRSKEGGALGNEDDFSSPRSASTLNKTGEDGVSISTKLLPGTVVSSST